MEYGGAVVLKAMAARKPVIATDWGGPADYLDGTCGILVPPTHRDGFVNGLAAAILKLADDPVLREKMGQAGYGRIVEHYDWEVKVDQMMAIYQEVVAAESSKPPPEPIGT